MTISTDDSQLNLVCSYVNATKQTYVARIANVPNWYFERVVLPGERLIFEAPKEGIMEIYSSQWANVILAAKIACSQLAIAEPSNIS